MAANINPRVEARIQLLSDRFRDLNATMSDDLMKELARLTHAPVARLRKLREEMIATKRGIR